MEPKKNPKADLRKKAFLFLNIGFVISLVLVISAFQYRFPVNNHPMDLGKINETFEQTIEIPPTEQSPPPPPMAEQPRIIEVANDKEIDNDIKVNLDIEANDETKIAPVVINQEPIQEEKADEIFTIVEDQPTPKGGMAAFYEYVAKHMEYPSQARRMGVEGKVYVQFVVDKDGSLTDINVLKGIGAGCDKEAVAILKGAPRWVPGKQRGRPVKVRMVIPIVFRLGT
jgi:periplasmic protein TonB